jgi:hypothetical protein
MHNHQYQGYLAYNFLDHESHIVPGYMTGTYLGKKKIFNIAAGFITQKNATWTRNADGAVAGTADTAQYHPLKLWSVETFLDMPLNTAKQTAISAYAGYFNTNYGPTYVRYNGIMNPANGQSAGAQYIAGNQGNAFPMFGTGQVVYLQVGYLFPAGMLGQWGTLMPYATSQMAKYDALGSNVNVYGAGCNLLIDGHRSKLTLDYQNRPDFHKPTTDKPTSAGRRSQVTLQYQIFI